MKLENLRDNGSFARNTWFQIKWLILKKKKRFFVGLCPLSDVYLLFWVSIGYIWNQVRSGVRRDGGTKCWNRWSISKKFWAADNTWEYKRQSVGVILQKWIEIRCIWSRKLCRVRKLYFPELVSDTYESRYVVVYPSMGVINAETGSQSRKNSAQHVILESTNGSHLVWYYRNGLKSEAYDQESYAE